MVGFRRGADQRSPRRIPAALAAVTLLALALAPLALSSVGAGAAEHGDTAADDDGGTETVATLEIEHDQVDVRRDGKERFRPARDGQAIREGDTVRTDSTGRATIHYTDESFTRLDVDTTFEVVELTDDEGTRHTRGSLEQGQVWNRVEDLAETEAFETEGAGAVAAVTGTAYSVTCASVDECTFTGVVHDVLLSWLLDDQDPISIDELEFVLVRRGQPGTEGTLTLEEFFADQWIQDNLGADVLLGFPGPDRFRGVTIVRTVAPTGEITIEVGGISVTNPGPPPPSDTPPSNPPPSSDPPSGGAANGYGAGGGTNRGGASFSDDGGHPVGNCMASGAHHKPPGGGQPDPGPCLN